MSDAAEIEKLVRELIATGTMWPETISDLERFVEEARAGTLSEDDERYLVAFHAKTVLQQGSETADDDPSETLEVLDAKFVEIKRRFAERYQPDSAEPTTRGEVFAEFWAEFEAVEKS